MRSKVRRLVPYQRAGSSMSMLVGSMASAQRFREGDSDVLVTADDQRAKELVLGLFDGLPFRALDAGPLPNSRTIERMTLLSREIAIRYGHYPRVTWRLLGREAVEGPR